MNGVSRVVRRRVASLAVLLAASSVATCRLDDLLTPGEIGALASTPTELADSALAGSTAIRQYDVQLRVDGTGERLRFNVDAELNSSWLILGPATGTAPGTYSLSVDPTGLAAGEYVDTVAFTAEGPDAKQLRVPVRFKLLPCAVTDLGTLPANAAGTLGTTDCASPRFADRFARRYRITAQANDSVSVVLGSAAFGPSVAIERVGTPTPIATTSTCTVAAASACLRYVLLATAGDYIIEATTTGARATGAYTLAVGRPRAPAAPTSLAQLTVALPVTPITVGASIPATQLTLQGAATDPDLDSLRLQVELRPVGQAYTGTATHVSALGTGTLSVLATGLIDGTSYKWRARAIDGTGRTSGWTEFGGNAPDAADIIIAVPEAPAAPTGLAQRRDDGVTDIALGGVTDESVVRVGATVTDNDPTDQIRLEVEVRPVGTALTNTATASSVPVTSGTFIMVPVSGLSDDIGYRWQARAVDQTGRASAWVRFSPSGETFRVALPPTQLAFVVDPSATAAGSAIAPAVQVAARDASGATLTSFTGAVTVALGDDPGAATLSGTRTVNAVAGVATFSDLRLDRVGTGYTLIATALGGAITTESDPFSIGAATAQSLAFGVTPTTAVAGVTIAPAITVVARDAFGNVASGFTGTVSLALASNADGATLLGATTVAAAGGVATFSGVRVERAAAGLALVASAGGFTDATSASFAVTNASANALRLTTPPSATGAAGAALAQQPVIVVEDAFGNRVRAAGTVVTAAIASGTGATLANAQATTDADGVATFAGLSITGPSGAYTLAFASPGLTGASSGTITLGAGGPARLALAVAALPTAPNGAVLPTPPVVRLEDAAGNPVAVPGIPIGVAITSGAPALSGTTTVLTDANGEATFTDLVITGLTGQRTLSFTSPGLLGVTGVVAVTAGAAFDIASVAGNGQTAVAGSAVAIAPAVRVRDESQNPVPGVAVTFAVTGGGGSIVPPGTVITDANGLATLTSWTLGASAGVNTIEASVAGLVGSPVTFTATATAGSASQLAISGGNALTGPVGTELGTAHEVRVTDANGNPVAGVTVTWTAVGGGSVTPPTSVTDADGRATAVRTLGAVAGAQSTTASATLIGGPASVTFALTATVGGATQMARAGGDGQSDTVGATLPTPLSVIVRDALNNPVAGVLITWTVLDGGGSIAPATSVTNASGIASASWTLGTVTSAADSTQLARASGVGNPANFVATTRPGAVSATVTTVVVAPASIPASRDTPATVTVTARDRFGNAIQGRTVTLSATGVGNTIVQPAAVTDATGVTTGAIGATASGARTIVASVDGMTATQQPTLTVVAAPAAALLFTSVPASASAGASLTPPPEVGVVDSLGNRNFTFAGMVTVGLAVNPAAGTLGGTLTRNAVAGVASFPGLSLDRAASGYVLVATATGLAGATSGTIDIGAGGVSAARSLVSVSSASLVAGQDTATITVTARDANDNPVAGATVTLAASGATSALEQPLAVTDANGVATGRVSATATGLRTISATIGAVAVTQTAAVTVLPAAVSGALSTMSALPTSIAAGGPVSTITVTARDTYGNLVPGATIVLAATGTGNTIVQPPVTAPNGQAAGTFASTVAGTKTVTATANGVALTTGVDVTVSAGAVSGSVSTLSIAPDTIVAAGAASTVTVTARDASGNPVAGATVLLAATGSGNTVTQPAAITDANGVATGSVASTASGAKTVSATIDGTLVTGTATLVVRPGAVSPTLSTLALAAATTSADAPAITITATARDAQGNVIPGLPVVLAATGTGNTLTQPVAVTDANGVATGALRSSDAGVKTVSATIDGVAIAMTADLTVAAGAVSATQSSLVAAPDGLTTDGGASTITMTARDAAGNPIAGLTVVLAASGAGNTVTQPSAVTDANGVASGTLSSTVTGAKIVTATVGGVAIDQADTVTVTAGAISAGVSTVTVAPDTISADGGTSTITVTARDANGNAIAGQTVVLAATGTANTLTQPLAVTDANGVATGSLASTNAASKVISATIGGIAITATDTIVVRAGAVSGTLSTIGVSTATISAAVGSTTVTVTARDANGNPVPGVAVVLAATGSGNTVTQPVAVTDASGVATGSVSSTVSEAKTISATAGGVALTATAAVTVVPDAVSAAQSSVSVAPGSISADGASATVTVTARDANGNPVAGVSVALTATGTGNTIVQPSGTTGVDGIATGTISSTGAGAKTISATVNGVGVTQTAALTVTPGAVSATVTTVGATPASITAGGSGSAISITARDQHGNAIPGVVVSIAATGAGNTLTQPAAVTDAGGVATAAIASTVTGAKIVSATVAGVAITPTVTVTVVPGAVSAAQSTVVAAPAALSADAGSSTITVTARDANNNLIPGATVVLAASGAGNTLTQPAAVTNASGVATGALSSTVAGEKIVTATIDGVAITQSDTVAVASGAISAVQSTIVADPSALTAGAGTSTVTITARDANGNPISGATVTFTASGTGNTLTQPAAVTDANGVATGALASTGAGLKELIATIGGVILTSRDTVVVTAAALSTTTSTIEAVPALLTAGAASATINVTVRDAFGNPVEGVAVVLAATGTGNTLVQPSALTDVDGHAAGSLSSTGTGLKELTATLDAQALVARDTITVSAAAVSATLSSIVAAPDTIDTDGAASTVTITARDAFGNAVVGAAVTFTASGSGNALTQPAALTDASGVATGSFSATVAGAKELAATISGVPVTLRDSVFVVPGAISAAVSTVSAAPATLVASVGSSTITVTARDASGNPIAGAAVVVAATGSGNTLTQPAAVTDANGVATASLSSTVSGQKIVSATIAGVAVTQTDTITVSAGNVSAALTTVVAAQPTMIAGGAATTITVTARDANGNAIEGLPVTLSATGAGNTLTQPAAVTDANGVATGAITSTVSGDKVVSATVDGVPVTPTATVTITPAAISAATSTVAAAPGTIVADGSASTITVTARDQFSNVVPGATVVLGATGASNTLTQPAAVTDANGVATGALSSTAAGTKTVSATIGGVGITQTADIIVSSGAVSAATSTVSAAPASISADGGASTITITARDANGNPIAGASVTLVATGTGNTLTQPTGVTGANGEITGAISSTAAGTKTITATIGTTQVTQTAEVTVAAGAVTAAQSTVVALPTSTVAGAGTSTITITARDQHGNPVAGASVTLAANGTNTLTQPSGTTDANGQITGTLASNEAGAKVVTATIGAVTVTQTATVTVTAAAVTAAQSSVAVSDATIAAGTGSTTVTVTARDQFGNPVPGVPVVIAATGNNNTITQPAAVTDANGVATGTFTSTTSEAKTISATADGVAITQTQAVTVVPDVASGAQSSVAVSAASFVAGDAGITVTVTARDGSGNPVAGVTVVISATGTGNSITQPVGTTGVDGIATGTLTSTGAGAKTVSATVNGVAVTQTQAVTVSPAAVSAATSTVSADPTTLNADGGSSTITVTARDVHGNLLAGRAVVLAATGSGNTVTQPAGNTDANGVATGSFSSTGAGNKTISATIDGVAVTQTAAITVEHGIVSAATTTVTADPTSLVAGSGSSTITVTARDAGGNPISGANVILAPAEPGSTVTQPATPTDVNGVAQGSVTATLAGQKFISAEVDGIVITQFATVTFTAGAVSAANTTVEADSTTITAGGGSTIVTVTALDAHSNPIPGLAVTLAASGSGNTVTQPSAVTDSAGVATGEVSSTAAGAKSISATVDGTPITQTANVTVQPGALSDTASRVVAAVADFTAGGSATVTFTARDAFGNPIAGLPVTFTVSGTGNTLTQPGANTDASGQTSGSFSSTAVGAKIITATIAGTPIVHADTVTVNAGAASAGNSTLGAAPGTITAGAAGSTITATVLDDNNNPVPGATVTFAATGTGNTLTDTTAVTDATGVATSVLTSTIAGTKVVSASIGATTITQTANVTVEAAAVSAATTTVEAAPTSLTAGAGQSTITVTARDQFGNVVGDATVVLAATVAGTLTQPAGNTGVNGVATGTYAGTTAGAVSITATVNGVAITDDAAITIEPAAVDAGTSFVAISPSAIASGGSSTVTVTARDAYGNVVPNQSVLIGATGGDASVTQPAGNTDASGVATGSVSATLAGTKTVSATIAGTPITQTQVLTVTAGAVSAANSSVSALPATISADGGAPSVITVTVRDAAGNLVSGATVTLAATGTGNTVNQPTDTTDANGVATGSLSSGGAGPKVITATANGVAIDEEPTVTVTPGVINGGGSTLVTDSTTLAAGNTTIVTVTVFDFHGNRVPGATVVISASGTGNTIVQPAGPTDANGVATGTFSSIVPEAKVISATADGTAVPDANVTVVIGPVSLGQSSLSASDETITTDETSTITVQLRDAAGNALIASAGTVVLSTTHGTLGIVNDNNDGTYTATFSATTPGVATITGTLDGNGFGDDVVVTVAPGVATQLVFSTQPSAADTAAAIPQFTVTALDANGNVATGFTGDIALAIASGTIGATITAGTPVTAIAGVATFTDVRIDSAGTYTLDATSAGVTGTTSSSFVITAPALGLGDIALAERARAIRVALTTSLRAPAPRRRPAA